MSLSMLSRTMEFLILSYLLITVSEFGWLKLFFILLGVFPHQIEVIFQLLLPALSSLISLSRFNRVSFVSLIRRSSHQVFAGNTHHPAQAL